MFCSSPYNLEGWVLFVFMCCRIGHLLCVVGGGVPTLLEGLMLTPLRSLQND